ncbi:mortality factor 4-like protein 1 [Bicyclus anynana]|uniref:Mortality factor 4-like protein 1 n=1 Tax=Bicyclus anynana TaxID=110368 RepID=A0A6J1N6Q1_BICAN|nr:mortality factor 4-like protein 1 [Bicyclus anynana]
MDNYLTFKELREPVNQLKFKALVKQTNNLKAHFNMTLSKLLYKFERSQYSVMVKEFPDTAMSEVYGGIHLLRLFVKLSRVRPFSCTAPNKKALKLPVVLAYVQDFSNYLCDNWSTFFSMQDYEDASLEYLMEYKHASVEARTAYRVVALLRRAACMVSHTAAQIACVLTKVHRLLARRVARARELAQYRSKLAGKVCAAWIATRHPIDRSGGARTSLC